MRVHIKDMHLQTGQAKLLCTAHGRTYEFRTSYTVHYSNNQCLKMITSGMIEDHDADPPEDARLDENQETGTGAETVEFSDFQ